MAVTSFNLRKQGRSSTRTTEGNTYTETYIVKTSSAADNEDTVYDDLSCPYIGLEYGPDPLASCSSVQVDSMGEGTSTWQVTATYRKNKMTRTVYNWSFTPIREVVITDQNDDVVTNSAGDPFSPGIERDIYIPTVKVVRSEQGPSLGGSFDMHALAELIGGVNTLSITVDGYVAQPGEALLKEVQIVDPPDLQGVGAWFTLTYTLMFKKNNSLWATYKPAVDQYNAWNSILLDAGTHHWDANNNKVACRNPGDKSEVKQPVPLDGDGSQLVLPTASSLLSSVVYRSFKIHPNVNLSQLAL